MWTPSPYAAITATFIKTPAEKTLLIHVQYMRERLDRQIIRAIVWVDTRDMGSDGLTKGAVPRDLLHQIMSGTITITHTPDIWTTKVVNRGVEGEVPRDTAEVEHVLVRASDSFAGAAAHVQR